MERGIIWARSPVLAKQLNKNVCIIPICQSVWKEKRRRALRISFSEPISCVGPPNEHPGCVWLALGDVQWCECIFWESLSLSKLLLMWFLSLHCLMWLFTASVSLCTDIVPATLSLMNTWELGKAGVTLRGQYTLTDTQVMYGERRNSTSLDADGMGRCQSHRTVSESTIVQGSFRRECGLWGRPEPGPCPFLSMLLLVSLSHRFCCPAVREVTWSLELFSPSETCESVVALVWKLISVCLCNIYLFHV